MTLKTDLLTRILSGPILPHICFAEQDAGEVAGGAGGEPAAEELELGEEAEGEPDDSDELEIGPDKIKVPKKVKEAWNGLQTKTQAEKEAIRVREAKIAEREAKIGETEKLHSAVLDEVADIKSTEKAIKGIDEKLAPYLKLSAADWMAWNEQEPEKAQRAQAAVQALRNEREGLMDQRAKSIQAAQVKYGEFQKKQAELTDAQKKTQAEFIAQSEKEIPARIKDWSPERAAAIQKYANESGISAEQYESIKYSPVALSVLDKAAKYDAAVARAAKAREAAAAANKDAEPKPEPLPKIKVASGSTASAAPRDSDPGDVWLKKREAELKRKGRR